ncbi:MAG: GtrA family protein [Eubacteriales bacterium]|nr:GtrA family protein [Eubacteriales bacterium]
MGKIKEYCKKYQEWIRYLFFGGWTTVVSLASFAVCVKIAGMNPLAANVISWILSVSFAYVTNKKWVFSSEKETGALKQMLRFYGGRFSTLVMEELILVVLISVLHFPDMPVKIAAQFLVLVANYVISKWFVF